MILLHFALPPEHDYALAQAPRCKESTIHGYNQNFRVCSWKRIICLVKWSIDWHSFCLKCIWQDLVFAKVCNLEILKSYFLYNISEYMRKVNKPTILKLARKKCYKCMQSEQKIARHLCYIKVKCVWLHTGCLT